MKRVFLPLFCIGILFGCGTEKVPEPSTEIGLFTPFALKPDYVKGMIKKLEYRSYWVTEQDGEFIMGPNITLKERDSLGWSYDFISYFDSLGLVTETRYLDDDEDTDSQINVQIEDGRYSTATFIWNGINRSKWVYLYNEAGHNNRMEIYHPISDTLLYSGDFETDDKGRWISAKQCNYKGEIHHTGTFEYNEAGLMVLHETKNADGAVRSWLKYTYDDNGLALTNEGMKSDSTMIHQEFRYIDFDEKGNWSKVLVYDHSDLQRMDLRIIEFY